LPYEMASQFYYSLITSHNQGSYDRAFRKSQFYYSLITSGFVWRYCLSHLRLNSIIVWLLLALNHLLLSHHIQSQFYYSLITSRGCRINKKGDISSQFYYSLITSKCTGISIWII